MRKLLIFMLLSASISLIVMSSCEKNDDALPKKIISPEEIGKIHNLAMDNFKNNYTNTDDLEGDMLVYDVINYNINYLKQELNKNGYSNFYNEVNLESQVKLFNTEDLAYKTFYVNTRTSKKVDDLLTLDEVLENFDEYNVYDKIDFMANEGVINLTERRIMKKLIRSHQLNYEGTMSDTQLMSNVNYLKTEFENTFPNLNNVGSYYVASSLEIAQNSGEWWEQQLDNYDLVLAKSNSKVAPWVAADIIGGAASGLFNIISQGASNGFRSVNAGGVGSAMLYGAVTSSVAPWSRIARIFR